MKDRNIYPPHPEIMCFNMFFYQYWLITMPAGSFYSIKQIQTSLNAPNLFCNALMFRSVFTNFIEKCEAVLPT